MLDTQTLVQSIHQHPAGLSLAELLVLHPLLARRTAQRWLGQLLVQGRIASQGEGRARRYLAAQTQTPHTGVARRPKHGEPSALWSQFPLSQDSKDILAYVQQPPSGRQPVGYQSEFLADYVPNQTAYLPASLRRQLHRMGSTALEPQPAGTHSRALLNRLLIDLSWASSVLEGNTYTRLDTHALIEHGQAATGKAALETQMILNHKAAIEMLVDNIDSAGFDRYTLMNLHSSLAENLLPNPFDEGRVRQHAVEIGLSVYRPLSGAVALEAALDGLLQKLGQIHDPFEQAFFSLVHLPYLQPFADVNKRCSRLLANLPLFRANLWPLTFLDVPEALYSAATLGVYELTRVELLRDLFVWAYERSTQEYLAIRSELTQPDPLRLAWRPFIKALIQQVVKQPHNNSLDLMKQEVAAQIPVAQQEDVLALVIDELRRVHLGNLARYGLRPSQWQTWCERQGGLGS